MTSPKITVNIEVDASQAERQLGEILLVVLLMQARQLGRAHRAEGVQPFGESSYVRWDAGSGDLLTAFGMTEPTTDENRADREHIVAAYCDALAGVDPEV